MTGSLILILLVAIVLQPPIWLQVTIGIGLTIGGAVFAWLLATALSRSRSQRTKSDPRRRRDP
jgi:positive regulator of sigma E activity